jgi:hypothetical protein
MPTMLLLLVLSITPALAADQKVTLTCNGTRSVLSEDGNYQENDSYSVGIVIDSAAQMVVGLDYPSKITKGTDTELTFKSSEDLANFIDDIDGSIDRVTGDMDARVMTKDKQTGYYGTSVWYSLKCKPTQRMF